MEAIKKVRKQTLLNPKVPQTRGPKVAPHPVLRQVTPLTLPSSQGGKPHPGAVNSLGFSGNPLSLPCWPPASGQKLLGGREFSYPQRNPSEKRQGHQEPTSPPSPTPLDPAGSACLPSVGPYLAWPQWAWLGCKARVGPRVYPPQAPRQVFLAQPHWALLGLYGSHE